MSKAREMVKVILYEDGHYEVNDAESHHATQRLYGFYNGQHVDIYYCKKNKWKMYLLKLLSTNEIDEQIKELQKKKEHLNDLRQKIVREINK